MKERFKKELTPEKAWQDLQELSNGKYKEGRTNAIGCLIFSAIGTVVLTVFIVAALVAGLGLSLAFLFMLAVCVLGVVSNFKPVKKIAVAPEKIEITADTVVSRRRKPDGDDYRYFLTFQHLGELEVPLVAGGFINLRPSLRPGYKTTEVGDSFLIAKYAQEDAEDTLYAFYPTSIWRLGAMTPEQIAEEIRQEEELISRLLACQRFPRLNILQDYFQESRYLHQVRQGRPREGMHLAESMAAQHFGGELVSALEFVLRYCPEALQEEARGYYTPTQLQLEDAVRRYIKTDNTKKKRQEAAAKLRSAFSREDPDE